MFRCSTVSSLGAMEACSSRPHFGVQAAGRTGHSVPYSSFRSAYPGAFTQQRPRLTAEKRAVRRITIAMAEPPRHSDGDFKKNTEFGYSRKDVLLIGVGLTGIGYGLYYGLQAIGVPAITAGNYVQLIVVLGLCIGWISTYLFRVANKEMTYVKQLEQYETEVMKRRLEEMPEAEYERLMAELEEEKQRRSQRSEGGG